MKLPGCFWVFDTLYHQSPFFNISLASSSQVQLPAKPSLKFSRSARASGDVGGVVPGARAVAEKVGRAWVEMMNLSKLFFRCS